MTKETQELQYRTAQTEKCSFLSLCNSIQHSMLSFTWIVPPLHNILRKNQQKTFSELRTEEEKCIDGLKENLTIPLVLGLSRVIRNYTVDTYICET